MCNGIHYKHADRNTENTVVKKRFVVAASLVAALFIAAVCVGRGWGIHASGQATDHGDHTEVRDALRRGGLREAARVRGHYVADLDPHWDFGLFDIEALTKNSSAVVVGVATKKVGSRLTPTGQGIVTDYEVEVTERIKGPSPQGSVITVSLPGGLVDFGDGTSAELKTPEFEHVKVGATYVLFLSEGENAYNAYALSGGPQGLVEIVSDTKLKSHGRPTDPVSKEAENVGKEKFLEKARGSAAKWPQPGKCCS